MLWQRGCSIRHAVILLWDCGGPGRRTPASRGRQQPSRANHQRSRQVPPSLCPGRPPPSVPAPREVWRASRDIARCHHAALNPHLHSPETPRRRHFSPLDSPGWGKMTAPLSNLGIPLGRRHRLLSSKRRGDQLRHTSRFCVHWPRSQVSPLPPCPLSHSIPSQSYPWSTLCLRHHPPPLLVTLLLPLCPRTLSHT